MNKARECKSKGQVHNAWFYYQQAKILAQPVVFMTTTALMMLNREVQKIFFFKQKTAYEIETRLEFRRVLFRSAVREGLAGRDRILVLTFSNSAAGEIARRIDERLRDDYGEAWISTFHSFCHRLLRDHAPDRERLLVNGFQEWIVMRKVLADIDPERLGALGDLRRSEAFAHDLLGFVALMKQNLVHPASLLLAAEASASDRL